MRVLLLALFAAVAAALPTTSVDNSTTKDIHLNLRFDVPPATSFDPNALPRSLDPPVQAIGAPLATGQEEFKESDYEIEHKTTAKGKKYRVFRPKGSKAARELALSQGQHNITNTLQKRGGMEPLNPHWIAGHNGYIPSSDYLNEVGGLEYWRIDIGGWIWKYRINFETHWNWDYGFMDETADIYWCDVWIPGAHHIDYNSGAPNMMEVIFEFD